MAGPGGYVSTERLRRALRIAAVLVATYPEVDAYVLLFEALEAELAARERQSDARERARRLVLESRL